MHQYRNDMKFITNNTVQRGNRIWARGRFEYSDGAISEPLAIPGLHEFTHPVDHAQQAQETVAMLMPVASLIDKLPIGLRDKDAILCGAIHGLSNAFISHIDMASLENPQLW